MKTKKTRSYSYPRIQDWRKAPKKFEWVNLQENEMTILEDNSVLYLLVQYAGVLRIHRFIRNAERPEVNSFVERNQYPPFEMWRKSRNQDEDLENGRYRIIINPSNGRALYVIGKYQDVVRIHPYLDNAISTLPSVLKKW